MTIAVGIFDLLTYAVPGSLYLGFLAYVALRPHLINPAVFTGVPALALVIAVAVASYLLGFLVYPLGALTSRLVPNRRERGPRQEFRSRVPAAKTREYVRADPFLLLSAIQLHDRDAAVEVMRLRASGLMLRNCAPAMLLGCGTAVVELFAGRHAILAGLLVILFAAGFVSLTVQGRRLAHWASIKTLELSFWLPDIDERLS